ncbi:hypothetical protein RV16_GL001361 [Enterococcus saccharolyticus]|nr:hypothetical protein RV16_GL001361 [Enterococcus saccharolyticus]
MFLKGVGIVLTFLISAQYTGDSFLNRIISVGINELFA